MLEMTLKLGFFLEESTFCYFEEVEAELDPQSNSRFFKIEIPSKNYEMHIYSTVFPALIQKNYAKNFDNLYLTLNGRPAYSKKKERGKSSKTVPFYEHSDSLDWFFIQNNLTLKLEGEKIEDFINEKFPSESKINGRINDTPYQHALIHDDFSQVSWNVLYSLLVLITQKLIKIPDFTVEFLNELQYEYSELALEYFYANNKPFKFDEFKHVLYEGTYSRQPLPSINHSISRKAIVTPSTIIFYAPELEYSNRVIRAYYSYKENFIRVGIADEDLSKTVWMNAPKVCDRIRKYLTQMTIGDRRFDFLGYSNSQLRSHSYWMYYGPEFNVEMLRSELGNFEGIKNVSKYAARLGQCFTSTSLSLSLPPSCVESIEEVQLKDEYGRAKYDFSDGVGRISQEILYEIEDKMNLKENITAIQVRLGGCKGVLTLDPSLSKKIQVRPSMTKFDAIPNKLEICSVASFHQAYLNRQIITLLSGLGVEDQVFIDIQRAMCKDLYSMFRSETKALECFESYSDYSSSSSEVIAMLRSGILIKSEPFLSEYLLHFFKKVTLEIKRRTRLLVEDGALLMGVMDEVGVLNYGEVYVCKRGTPLRGPVVVTKNPCLHPGDVRILIAKDYPELDHLNNVIAFPQKGPRPHPSEISGSDLDGDMYHVFWDNRFLTIQNYPPMDYTAAPERKHDQVNIPMVIDFLVDYMQNENLGKIANAHLVQSDMNGIYDKKSLDLARLHSVAVDFPKTGVAAKMAEELRPRKYPDFMEKSNPKLNYESEKVIGRLYREIKNLREPVIDKESIISGEFVKPNYEDFMPKAIEIESYYNDYINMLISRYCAMGEMGVWVALMDGIDDKRLESEYRNLLVDHFKTLKRSVKDFLHDYEYDDRRSLASAIYVYCRKIERSLGLPWVLHNYLLNLT